MRKRRNSKTMCANVPAWNRNSSRLRNRKREKKTYIYVRVTVFLALAADRNCKFSEISEEIKKSLERVLFEFKARARAYLSIFT